MFVADCMAGLCGLSEDQTEATPPVDEGGAPLGEHQVEVVDVPDGIGGAAANQALLPQQAPVQASEHQLDLPDGNGGDASVPLAADQSPPDQAGGPSGPVEGLSAVNELPPVDTGGDEAERELVQCEDYPDEVHDRIQVLLGSGHQAIDRQSGVRVCGATPEELQTVLLMIDAGRRNPAHRFQMEEWLKLCRQNRCTLVLAAHCFPDRAAGERPAFVGSHVKIWRLRGGGGHCVTVACPSGDRADQFSALRRAMADERWLAELERWRASCEEYDGDDAELLVTLPEDPGAESEDRNERQQQAQRAQPLQAGGVDHQVLEEEMPPLEGEPGDPARGE